LLRHVQKRNEKYGTKIVGRKEQKWGEKTNTFVFVRVLKSPCYDTPKNAMKNRAQKSWGEKNKNGGGKKKYICFFRVLNSPCYDTPKTKRNNKL
jgi:hypothetical protein